MKKLLIGYTGFVGQNLLKQLHYDDFANSINIKEFIGRDYDEITIAAGDARKWIANQDEEKDYQHIKQLFNDIKSINTKRIIFFSTVDVYNKKIGNEDDLKDNIAIEPYGKNRYLLEAMIKTLPSEIYIIRIPGLFGKGLKKNLIFDILNRRDLSSFNLESKFQWFYLDNLKRIIHFALSCDIKELNVSTEPISVKDVVELLDYKMLGECRGSVLVNYNLQSKYSNMFSGRQYFYSKDEVCQQLLKFKKDFI